MKKLASLLPHAPQEQKHHAQLDNIAVAMFPSRLEGPIEQYYLAASAAPSRTRYGLSIDAKTLGQVNPHIEGFDRLGENERHLINKTLFSEAPILVIVGAIGSGKTTFCRLLQQKLAAAEVPGAKREPVLVYVDLTKEDHEAFHGADETLILERFYEQFSAMLSEAVSGLYDLEEEVTTIWDRICNRGGQQTGAAFRTIKDELRSRGLDKWNRDTTDSGATYEAILKGRKEVRQSIRANKRDYAVYLAELLEDARINLLNNVRWGITVIVDNIDQLSLAAQQCLRRTLKPLLRKCDVRAVIMMRQSTWRIAIADAYAFPVDVVPHIGPVPSDAVRARLRWASNMEYSRYGILGDYEKVRRYTSDVEEAMSSDRRELAEFVDRVCGYSVRKAFVLAQSLFTSPFVTIDGERLNIHRLKKAMICGGASRFVWDRRGVLDNAFALQTDGEACYLLKLRMAYMLTLSTTTRPTTLRTLVERLGAFGYHAEETRIALNEMMLDSKRLAWTDSLLYFPDLNSFNAAGNSGVFLSKAGQGFLDLVCDLDYLEEVLLDVPVDPTEFGDARYDTVIGRITVVANFLKMLWRVDRGEVARFAEEFELHDYKKAFPSLDEAYVTSKLISVCGESALRVLRSLRPNNHETEVSRDNLSADLGGLRNEVAYKKVATAWQSGRERSDRTG